MSRPIIVSASRVLLCLSLSGVACTRWHVVPPVPDSGVESASAGSREFRTQYPPRQQFQLWRGRSATLLHAIRVNGARDSLSGVPFIQSPECDSCRHSFAIAEIDSLRTGDQEMTGVAMATLPFLALGLAIIFIRIGTRGD